MPSIDDFLHGVPDLQITRIREISLRRLPEGSDCTDVALYIAGLAQTLEEVDCMDALSLFEYGELMRGEMHIRAVRPPLPGDLVLFTDGDTVPHLGILLEGAMLFSKFGPGGPVALTTVQDAADCYGAWVAGYYRAV